MNKLKSFRCLLPFFTVLLLMPFGKSTALAQSGPSQPNSQPVAAAMTPLERLMTEAGFRFTLVSGSDIYVTTFRGDYGERIDVYLKHQAENDLVSVWTVVADLEDNFKFPESVLQQVASLNLKYPVIKWAIDFDHGNLGVACELPREVSPAMFGRIIITLAKAADREAPELRRMLMQAKLVKSMA